MFHPLVSEDGRLKPRFGVSLQTSSNKMQTIFFLKYMNINITKINCLSNKSIGIQQVGGTLQNSWAKSSTPLNYQKRTEKKKALQSDILVQWWSLNSYNYNRIFSNFLLCLIALGPSGGVGGVVVFATQIAYVKESLKISWWLKEISVD